MKVIVCGSLAIVILLTTLVAGAVVVSPDFGAVIARVRADTAVSVVPLIEQAEDVVAKLTG